MVEVRLRDITLVASDICGKNASHHISLLVKKVKYAPFTLHADCHCALLAQTVENLSCHLVDYILKWHRDIDHNKLLRLCYNEFLICLCNEFLKL